MSECRELVPYTPPKRDLILYESPCRDMVQTIKVFGVFNLLDPGRNRKSFYALQGSTLKDMANMVFPGVMSTELEPYVHILWRDFEIERDKWHLIRPKPGESIVVKLVPSGGNMLRSILGLAVSLVSLGIGAFLGPVLGTFGASLISMAFQAIAGLLINALIPVQQPKGDKDKKQYSIQGWKNNMDPDGVVPNVFGTIRFAPPYAAAPYTEIIGNDTFIRAIFCIGYGPVSIDQANFQIGDTLISKFRDVEIEIREGYPTDEPFTLYTEQVIQEQLNHTLQYTNDDLHNGMTEGWPTTHVTATNTTKVVLDFQFPNGLYHTQHSGNIEPSQTRVKIRARQAGTVIWTVVESDFMFKEKKQKPFTKSYTWIPPSRAQYEIEVTRLDVEKESSRTQHQIDWVVIRSFRPEYPINFNHPLAMVAIRVRASQQLHGVLDEFNLQVSRIAQHWNGSAWVVGATNNPASAFRLEMQGPQMAYPRSDGQLDLLELQEWSEYCDDHNLEYNRVHDFEASWRDNLQDICFSGRATPQDRGDKWSVFVDKPQDTVMAHITPRNSFDFEWNRPYAKYPDGFVVKFFDETNQYIEAKRVIPWPGFVGDPVLTEAIDLPGNTNPDTIWIEARRAMYAVIHRPDRFTVSQDYESLITTRGDLVMLNHDVLDSRQMSGRVLAVDSGTNTIILDEYVVMEVGSTYAIRFRNIPAGATDLDTQPAQSLLRTVTLAVGRTNSIVVSGVGDLPEVGDLFEFGVSAQVAFECIVQRIERGDDLTARLTLMAHAPEIETLTDAEVPPAWDGKVGQIIDFDAPAPLAPLIREILSGDETDSNDVEVFVEVASASTAIKTYELQHRLNGTTPFTSVFAEMAAGAIAFTGYTVGQLIDIKVRGIGLNGAIGPFTAITTYTFGINNNVDQGLVLEVA